MHLSIISAPSLPGVKKLRHQHKTALRMNRRNFIRQSAMASGAIIASNILLNEVYAEDHIERLVILHTNDVHSRLEPFPMDGGRNQGLGGVAARAELIQQVRNE